MKLLVLISNLFLVFVLVKSFSHHRSHSEQSLENLDDNSRDELLEIMREQENGNSDRANELLENSDLDPQIKSAVKEHFDELRNSLNQRIEREVENLDEDSEAESKNDEKTNENDDKVEVESNAEDKNEDIETQDVNKQEINEIPVLKNNGIFRELNEDLFPNVAKQFNIENNARLNTRDSKKNFNSILNSVRSATKDLEKAIKDGNMDMEKALQLSDLQNVVSAFKS